LVFKARELNTNRIIAAKILYPRTVADPKLMQAFRREVYFLIKLAHPNIIKGYFVTLPKKFNKLHYLIIEYVPGPSIQELIDLSKQQAESAAGIHEELTWMITMQAAKARDYLQLQYIFHRDIKPDNLLIDKAKGIVKLCDLSFAQPITLSTTGDITAHTTSGTAAYMSPEQSQEHSTIGIRSDIYSLGATLYHMGMARRHSPARII